MTAPSRRAFGAFAIAALTAGALATAAPTAHAANPASPGPVVGRVTITAKSAGVGVGYTWGDGVLAFGGKRYYFTVKGVSIANVGYSSIVGHGRVYNLKNVADFSGTYAASTGEATLGNGIGGQFLINGNGVQLRIDDVTKGARLSGSADGIQLTLKN